MAKQGKLLDKLLSGSYDIRFEEFITLLDGFGFVLDRVRGSHHVFSHPGVVELLSVQPRHDDKAKPYQLRQFLKFSRSQIEDFDGWGWRK
jgi:predicted RNA binding protein YcfA (HicA-like mRNA interferase family)